MCYFGMTYALITVLRKGGARASPRMGDCMGYAQRGLVEVGGIFALLPKFDGDLPAYVEINTVLVAIS